MPHTVFEKIWNRHVICDLGDGWALLHIDRHLLHDLSGPPALVDVARRGLTVRNPEMAFATPDHAVSTMPGRTGGTFPLGARLRVVLKEQTHAAGIRFFDLGEEGQGIVHVMGALHAPLDALFELTSQRALRPEEIKHIEIDLSDAAYHHGWWKVERPLTPIGAQMNVAYAIAVAILDGAAMIQQFSPQRMAQDDVWELIPRITARHDRAFDTGRESQGNTRLRISLTDGTHLECFRAMPRTITQPLSNAEIAAKYRTLTREIIDQERQTRIAELVLHLEDVSDIADLCRVLAPPVGAVFAEGGAKDE